MAASSLYEIKSFLNRRRKSSGIFPFQHLFPPLDIHSMETVVPACLLSQDVKGKLLVFWRVNNKRDAVRFRKKPPVHASTLHWAGIPRSVRVGVVVLVSPTRTGAHHAIQKNIG